MTRLEIIDEHGFGLRPLDMTNDLVAIILLPRLIKQRTGTMNWDAISAVGELVGATAVVISIIYLALQVRQNSSHVRSSGYQTAAQSANQMFDSWSTHPETLKIFQVAQESYDSLNESDQSRSSNSIFASVRLLRSFVLPI